MMDASPPLLGPTQRKIVAFAAALAALVISAMLLGLLVVGFCRTIAYFSAVIWPLATAGIAALILRPVVDMLQKHLKLGQLAAVIVLYTAVLLAAAGIALAVAPAIVAQTTELAASVPDLWSQAVAYLRQHSPEWIGFGRRQIEHPAVQQIADALGGQLKEVASGLLPGVKSALGGLRSAVAFLVGLALIPVYLFFLLRFTGDPLKLVHGLLPFMPDNIRDDVVFLVGEFVKLVVAFFRGQILVGLALGVFYATGFSIAGLKFGLVIGLAMGVGNMVPYLGTVLGLSVAIPLAFFQPAGGMWLAGTVLAVFAAAQTLDSTVLTPRIMGQQTGLPPLAIIVAIMFWGTALDGMLGMVLAIPLTAFLVTAWRLLKRKYILAASPNA